MHFVIGILNNKFLISVNFYQVKGFKIYRIDFREKMVYFCFPRRYFFGRAKLVESNLVILGKDLAYLRNLCDYICNSHIIKYRVVLFVDVYDYFLFKQENRVDLLLIDEQLKDECAGELPANTYFLTRLDSQAARDIFMYQSMELIVKKISIAISSNVYQTESSRRIKIYSLLQASGDGLPQAAASLAGYFGSSENTLMILIDASFRGFGGEDNSDLSELIYNLKVHKDMWFTGLRGLVRTGGAFDYVLGCNSFTDITSLRLDNILDLLAGIVMEGKYSNIVFGINDLFDGCQCILEKSEKIFIVSGDNQARDREIRRQIELMSEGNVDKLISVDFEVDKLGKDASIQEILASKSYRRLEEILKNLNNSMVSEGPVKAEKIEEQGKAKTGFARLLGVKS